MAKVCVTGATGFVGAQVARALAERGEEVRVVYRNPDKLDALSGVKFRRAKADALDFKALRRAFRGSDVVFHTAGYVASSPAERVWRLNAHGPLVAVEAAAGEVAALDAGERHGIEVVVVNPAYVLGVPVNRAQKGETSTRTVGNYLRGRLPAVLDAPMNFVDVEDVAIGHVLAADPGKPGERYILGGQNITWAQLVDRIAELSDVHYPVM